MVCDSLLLLFIGRFFFFLLDHCQHLKGPTGGSTCGSARQLSPFSEFKDLQSISLEYVYGVSIASSYITGEWRKVLWRIKAPSKSKNSLQSLWLNALSEGNTIIAAVTNMFLSVMAQSPSYGLKAAVMGPSIFGGSHTHRSHLSQNK